MEEQKQFSEDAVSELIGGILLISIVTLAAAVIVVMLLSQPSVSHIPKIDAVVTNESRTVYLYHGGGDAIEQGQLDILINGEPIAMTSVQVRGEDNSWPWDLGKTLIVTYPGPEMPARVDLIYTGDGSGTLLKTATLGQSSGSATGPDSPGGPGTTPPTGSITLTFDDQDELDKYVQEQFVKQLEEDSIYFYRNGNCFVSGTMVFSISQPGGYYTMGTTRTPLTIGDEVEIRMTNKPELRVFMIGNKSWHVKCAGNNKFEFWVNGVKKGTTGGLTESRLTGYIDGTSTLTLVGDSTGSGMYTELYVNDVEEIGGVNKEVITISNIIPAKPTLLVLSIPDVTSAEAYFIGKASSVIGERGSTVTTYYP